MSSTPSAPPPTPPERPPFKRLVVFTSVSAR
jgi:hypothetical protein